MAKGTVKETTTKEVNKPRDKHKKKDNKKNSKGAGRKSAYYWKVEPKLNLVSDWMRNGATEAQVAKKLNVGVRTFYTYKKKHEQLRQALKAREEVDAEVVSALYQRALGYTTTETRDYYEKDIEDGKMVLKTRTVFTRHIPADITASFGWLNNRRPSEWRQKQREEFAKHEREDDPITKSIKEELNKKEATKEKEKDN